MKETLDPEVFASLNRMILAGMGRREIAHALGISESTVRRRKYTLHMAGQLPHDEPTPQVKETEPNHATRKQ